MSKVCEFLAVGAQEFDLCDADEPELVLADTRNLCTMETAAHVSLDFLQKSNPELSQEDWAACAEWIVAVCADHCTSSSAMSVSLQYFNSALYRRHFERDELPSLAAACVLVACRSCPIRGSPTLNICQLQESAEAAFGPIDADQLNCMEQKLLKHLSWNTTPPVVPTSFVVNMLSIFMLPDEAHSRVVRYVKMFTIACAMDYSLVPYKPSVVAAAALLSALDILNMFDPVQAELYNAVISWHLKPDEVDLRTLRTKMAAVASNEAAAASCGSPTTVLLEAIVPPSNNTTRKLSDVEESDPDAAVTRSATRKRQRTMPNCPSDKFSRSRTLTVFA